MLGMGTLINYAPVAHSQSNDQVEVSNRSIKDRLKNRLSKVKGKWTGEMPNVMELQNCPQKAIGETPIFLAFRVEVLLPIENSLPLSSNNHFRPENENGLKSKLDLIDEHRTMAKCCMCKHTHFRSV